ncbi:hypothetical protein D3C72_1656600 [compost metagenome]
MAGQQNHGQVGIARLQLLKQLQAVHAGHAHITEDHPGKMHGQLAQAVFGTAEQLHRETGQAQPLLDRCADAGFIVDDHYRIEHQGSRSQGRVRLKRAPPG